MTMESLGGWTIRRVGDVLTDIQTGFASGKHNQEQRGVPHLRPMNISRDGEIVLSDVKYVEGDSDRRIRAGDILFNNTNSPALVGKTAFFNLQERLAFSNHMTRLRVGEGMDAKFFALYFNKLWSDGYFERICSNHVNQASVSSKRLQTIDIPFPPLAEQRRIVEILEEQFSRLDAALACIRTVREKAKAFRRSLLQAAFSGEFSERPNGEWKAEPLSNIAELSLGVMLDRAKDTGESQVPYLANINVRWGSFETDKLKTMQVLPNQVDRATVRFGDVVVCEGGEPGRCAIWRGENGIAIQKALHRVRPMGDLVSTYLYYFFEFRFRGVQSDELFTGTTIRHLPKEKLATLEIPLPSVGEQKHIVEILEEQFSRLNAALEETNQLEARIASERRSLLHAAFSGALTEQWRTTHNG